MRMDAEVRVWLGRFVLPSQAAPLNNVMSC
jgi:hypothetical protein